MIDIAHGLMVHTMVCVYCRDAQTHTQSNKYRLSGFPVELFVSFNFSVGLMYRSAIVHKVCDFNKLVM